GPAATSRGASAVPMKPLAPVTSTLATRAPPLRAQLAELLGGEAGPAVSGVRHHDVAEAGLGLSPPPELLQAETHVVVALGHPDAVREALDDGAVAGERPRGVARTQQARGAEERPVGGGRRLAPQLDGTREVPHGRAVVLRREGLPAALVEEAGAVVAGDVPGGGDPDEHDPEAQGPRPHGVEGGRQPRRWFGGRRGTDERREAEPEAEEARRSA